MSKELTVNNTTFNYPTAGEPPGWGEDATGWAEAVTGAISSISGFNTVYETQMAIPDVVLVPTDVITLAFNNGLVHSAEINYRCFRKTDSVRPIETGVISILYNPSTLVWDISQNITVGGGTGITFSIDSSGQLKYTASTLAGIYDATESYLRFKTISTLGVE